MKSEGAVLVDSNLRRKLVDEFADCFPPTGVNFQKSYFQGAKLMGAASGCRVSEPTTWS